MFRSPWICMPRRQIGEDGNQVMVEKTVTAVRSRRWYDGRIGVTIMWLPGEIGLCSISTASKRRTSSTKNRARAEGDGSPTTFRAPGASTIQGYSAKVVEMKPCHAGNLKHNDLAISRDADNFHRMCRLLAVPSGFVKLPGEHSANGVMGGLRALVQVRGGRYLKIAVLREQVSRNLHVSPYE